MDRSVPEPFIEVDAGETIWRFDTSFLTSHWTCIWGRGCQGILDFPADELGQGCCSVGAELDGDDAPTTAALASFLKPARFQYFDQAQLGGIFSDDTRTNTRVVDGACIFLNRPQFEGGAGCALHLAAIDANESPIDWKPEVCWQLPIKVDWEPGENDTEIATLRRWSRADWGDEGPTMHWCCTEGSNAYIGAEMVIDSLSDELEAIIGTPVFIELQSRLG